MDFASADQLPLVAVLLNSVTFDSAGVEVIDMRMAASDSDPLLDPHQTGGVPVAILVLL
jgi:hypothetical protein